MSSKAATSQSPPKAVLDRLVKITSTLPGLDGSLMLAAYTSPFVVTLLLRIARFRAAHPRLGGKGNVGLVRLAEGWGNAADSIREARTIMRLAGLLPMFQWLFALHPKPLRSLYSLLTLRANLDLRDTKTLATIQCLALIAYYPLEHITWFAKKGVLRLTPTQAGRAGLWSVRFWAVYVMLELYKLSQTYTSLSTRTQKLRNTRSRVSPSEAEGYELKDEATTAVPTEAGEDAATLKEDWTAWQLATITNLGWAPLTIHWSTPTGLWESPFITAGFGTIAGLGKMTTQWRNSAK